MPDLHSAPTAYADDETVDTDFVHHLVRGADLLQSGDPDRARSMLERALQLSPNNERGQNLLALSYFKLGLYDRAEELYRALVGEHPQDATLRINLGLVQLKARRDEEAVQSFSAALKLAPGHRKAQNYLGLAYLQKEDFEHARTWFERAGNATMAERAATAALVHDRTATGLTPAPPESQDVPLSAPETTPVAASGLWAAHRTPAPVEAQAPSPDLVPDFATFTAAHRLAPHVATPFAVTPELVVVDVRRELLTRVDGLVATFGAVELRPELKRFRGRVTDKPFGDAARRMMRVSGTGRLWVAPGGRRFQTLDVGDEPAYFREEALFAFEESLLFENGRVPSRHSSDLQLVHLRGRGRLLVVSRHPPRAVEVARGEAVRVPVELLLGWHGNVAPRVVALTTDEAAAPELTPTAVVELTGEGRVLLDLPA